MKTASARPFALGFGYQAIEMPEVSCMQKPLQFLNIIVAGPFLIYRMVFTVDLLRLS